MKLFIASDLHLEFWKPEHLRLLGSALPPEPVDVLVLAGDITVFSSFTVMELKDIFDLAKSKAKKAVLFILGNHEFYGGEVHDVLAYTRNEVSKHVTVLDHSVDKIVEIEGRRFIGCTTWFGDGPFNASAEKYMNDFRQIRNFKPWVYEEYAKSVVFLNKNVREGDIVITHHLPTVASVPKRYKNSTLNCFFVSGVESIIHDCKPALWIHGHTHTTTDHKVGETRVICNPFGYPGEVSNYDRNKVIEI